MTALWESAPEGGWERVLLKLSGEAFSGGTGLGVDPDVVASIAAQIAEVVSDGRQVAVVIGGGNYFRGAQLSERGMDRARADYMGMLGTVMNCLALQDFLEKAGVETRVQTAIAMGQVAEPYVPRRAIRHLQKGRVVIFGAGLGVPYFSTDSCAAQRALEIGITIAGGADIIMLDEPCAGMSHSETDLIVDLIRKVTEGKTLVIVEHDMGVIFDLADKISVLVYGEIIESAPPEAVRASKAVQEAYLGTTLEEA